MKRYYLDLFHGIGGFALAAHWAGLGFDGHYCSDIEPWIIGKYKERFPGSVQLGDIKTIDPAALPQGEWIITGGFPCQDISVAGNRRGLIDEEGNIT
jgi:DNA (cytosine-5)-methyltransferase 1